MTAVASVPVRLSTVVGLVAGRGAFRLTSQLMPVALLVVWGSAGFGRYANAVGLCMWLLFVPTAAEKAALKVLPRLRVLAPPVARLTLVVAAAPVVVLLAALAAALLLRSGSTATLYLAAASWSAATGLLMTVAGLHRLSGRPLLDLRAFGALTLVMVAATAATWVLRWGPAAHLLVLLAGAVAVLAAAIGGLPASWLRGIPHRPAGAAPLNARPAGSAPTVTAAVAGRALLPAFGRSVALLGLPDVLDVAAVSAVFLVLAAAGRTPDSGPLYLALTAAAVAGSFMAYLLRVYQPTTSARLRGTGGAAGRASAIALLRVAERTGLAFALVLAVVLLLPAGRAVFASTSGATPYLVLGALVAVEIVISTLVTYAVYLLENTNGRVLTVTAATALVGLVAAAAAAALLVPWLGAAGGFVALVSAIAVKAAVLRRVLLARHPSTVH